MKKSKFLIFATALFAVGTLTTSCFSSDDPVVSAKVTKINGAKYSIVASSNLNATFSVDVDGVGAQADVKTAYFTGLDSKTVKITAKYTGADAADYVNTTQTTTVKFSELNTSAAVMFTFVKKSTTKASQADVEANGAILTNDDQTVGKAIMTLSVGTQVTNSVSGDYSISVYTDGVVLMKADDISAGTELPLAVCYLDCQPNGANLSIPAQITFDYGTALAGATVKMELGSLSVSAVVGADGKATFDISTLGIWQLLLNAKVEAIKSTTESVTSLKVNTVSGTNTFTYTKNVGVETTLTGFLALYVEGVFGNLKSQVEETASFDTDGVGIANVTVTQQKKVYTLSYGGKSFDVIVWGPVAYKVEMNGETSQAGHSGGSGM